MASSAFTLSHGNHFDAVIIGAGMSGLAAGIRLALYDKNVLILERHNAIGGLNSFYSIKGRKYDVGLHAVTNYVSPGTKRAPLTKLFRQLRIPPEAFDLCPQNQSRIQFPNNSLVFNNHISRLESDIADQFPDEIDGFQKLCQHAKEHFGTQSETSNQLSARSVLKKYLNSPLLIEMLLTPLMYYGSSQENDMPWPQFAVMFQSIFLEGFARPFDGVRVILRALKDQYKALGGKRKMKCGVKQIITESNKVSKLILDNDIEITADKVISSVGLPETQRLCSDYTTPESTNLGQLSFVESITSFIDQPKNLGWEDTIVFFNDSAQFHYQKPDALVDIRSGVICFPNNYQYHGKQKLPEGILRITTLANYDKWTRLPEEAYLEQKEHFYHKMLEKALSLLPQVDKTYIDSTTTAIDMFTPRTVTKYTGHLNGAIYGAKNKCPSGKTHIDNLYICGTDQGFLGIVGAMISGITIANQHVLA